MPWSSARVIELCGLPLIMDCNNVPIAAIGRILRHENRTATEIYLHGIGDMERAAIVVYEHARQNSHTKDNGVSVRISEPQLSIQIHKQKPKLAKGVEPPTC